MRSMGDATYARAPTSTAFGHSGTRRSASSRQYRRSRVGSWKSNQTALVARFDAIRVSIEPLEGSRDVPGTPAPGGPSAETRVGLEGGPMEEVRFDDIEALRAKIQDG